MRSGAEWASGARSSRGGRRWSSVAVIAALTWGLLSAPSARAETDTLGGELRPQVPELSRYIFLPRVDDDGAASLDLGLGYGTRDTRFMGPEGLDQSLTLRVRPSPWLGVEVVGRALLDGGDALRTGGGVNLLARVYEGGEGEGDLALELGGGYAYDLRGDHVLGFSAALGRHFGEVEVATSARVEVPLTGERDEVDLLLNLAASLPVTAWYTQGVELAAEDLEALWEPEEAEGGARILLGPTALLRPSSDTHLRANLSAVYAPPAAGAPDPERTSWGLLARLVVGVSFR